jgi:hypothetical protein
MNLVEREFAVEIRVKNPMLDSLGHPKKCGDVSIGMSNHSINTPPAVVDDTGDGLSYIDNVKDPGVGMNFSQYAEVDWLKFYGPNDQLIFSENFAVNIHYSSG